MVAWFIPLIISAVQGMKEQNDNSVRTAAQNNQRNFQSNSRSSGNLYNSIMDESKNNTSISTEPKTNLLSDSDVGLPSESSGSSTTAPTSKSSGSGGWMDMAKMGMSMLGGNSGAQPIPFQPTYNQMPTLQTNFNTPSNNIDEIRKRNLFNYMR